MFRKSISIPILLRFEYVWFSCKLICIFENIPGEIRRKSRFFARGFQQEIRFSIIIDFLVDQVLFAKMRT